MLKGQEDVKKSILKFAVDSALKQIALECPISDRWAVGKHLGSKIKSRKLKEINFFTSSCHQVILSRIRKYPMGGGYSGHGRDSYR